LSISPEQSRAARGLLNWSQGALSEKAGVARATLAEFESGRRQPIANNLSAIRTVLETAGVVFLDGGQCAEGGPGVRLRKVAHPGQPAEGEAGIIENNEM
jgi:transcriptional regulator with XRE-family HTH domain